MRGGNADRVLMFISDGLLVIPLFLILVMLAMIVRANMNLDRSGIDVIGLRLGMGRARDPLDDLEPCASVISQRPPFFPVRGRSNWY